MYDLIGRIMRGMGVQADMVMPMLYLLIMALVLVCCACPGAALMTVLTGGNK